MIADLKGLVLIFAFALAATATQYCQKRVALEMGHYPYVLSSAQPLCTSTCFGLIFLLSRLSKRHLFGAISGQDAKWSALRPFALVGAVLSISNVLMFFGLRGDLVAGPLAVLLHQTVVLFTAMFSIFLLRHSYCKHHLVGAAVVLLGIIMKSTIAMLQHPASSAIWAMIVVVLGMAALALGHVQVEHSLKALGQDMWWMWCWINVFEIPVAALCAPMQLWVLGVKPNMWSAQVHDGLACLVGMTSCPSAGAMRWFVAFVASLVVNRAIAALVISAGSATFLFLGSTAAVPLVTALYAIAPLPMHGHGKVVSFGIADLSALVFVVVGLLIFHLAPHKADDHRNSTAADGHLPLMTLPSNSTQSENTSGIPPSDN